jgi:hypothetical protein
VEVLDRSEQQRMLARPHRLGRVRTRRLSSGGRGRSRENRRGSPERDHSGSSPGRASGSGGLAGRLADSKFGQ